MYQTLLPTEDLLLPQSEAQFDELVEELAVRYHVSDKTHVAVVLGNQIQRLPPEQCFSTLDYLGHSILKSIAYSVALHKTRIMSQKAQIDHIAAILKANPYDQQALDALETASKEGSEYAKEILSLYRPVDAGDNILQMNPLADENKGSSLQTDATNLV
jgi:hypothetical protein